MERPIAGSLTVACLIYNLSSFIREYLVSTDHSTHGKVFPKDAAKSICLSFISAHCQFQNLRTHLIYIL